MALSHAVQISDGFYHPRALAWMLASAGLAVVAMVGLPARRANRPWGRALGPAILLAGLAWSFYSYFTSPPGLSVQGLDPLARALLACAVVATALIVVDRSRAAALWFPALLAAYAGLGAWMVHAAPRPQIDVFTVYTAALDALRAGHSPYGMTFQNIYGGTQFYAPGMVAGGQVLFGFPYPPLALLMAIPGDALGNYRYANVAAMVAGAAGLGYARGSRTAMLAAALLLFMSRGLFVIEQGWSEPFAICWLGAVIYASVRREPTWLPLGGLLAVKQHLVLALPFAGWLRPDAAPRLRVRETGFALIVAAAVTLPFLIADPRGFWRSVVTLQFVEPFRLDSLSLLVPFALSGHQLSPGMLVAVPIAAVLMAGLFAWWRAPRGASGFAATLGLVLIVLFLFGKKAFCNYYFLVLACWCAAIAATDADAPSG